MSLSLPSLPSPLADSLVNPLSAPLPNPLPTSGEVRMVRSGLVRLVETQFDRVREPLMVGVGATDLVLSGLVRLSSRVTRLSDLAHSGADLRLSSASAGIRRMKDLTRHDAGGNTMGLGDKIDNKSEELKGKGKEAAGKATDDKELEAEGHTDQAKGNVKQVGEKIKDVFKS